MSFSSKRKLRFRLPARSPGMSRNDVSGFQEIGEGADFHLEASQRFEWGIGGGN
jgi:hypothetical protein